MFTPHARGSTVGEDYTDRLITVYPACAGIDLRGSEHSPHRMGFTPHARGSTLFPSKQSFQKVVYPACAGIDQPYLGYKPRSHRLPRMRGDRPRQARRGCVRQLFTPHARGSTITEQDKTSTVSVYPACAGIDLLSFTILLPPLRLPRMRGDRPLPHHSGDTPSRFTPHARGSTGGKRMDLTTLAGLPRMRGGFTPHARGSTHCRLPGRRIAAVYPACAGIDRSSLFRASIFWGLPRMRGDRPPILALEEHHD